MYTIVIAEDEHWLRSELVEMVSRIGGEFAVVGEAVDGEDAWHMLNELWPSILLTDIRMPRMDGLQLIKEIDETGMPIVPIIISGYDEFTYAQQAVRYGVSEYLMKPVLQEELQDALKRSLTRMTMLGELNGCLKRINTFLDAVPTLDSRSRQSELDDLLRHIWNTPTAHTRSRGSIFSIFERKWIELIQGMDPSFQAAGTGGGWNERAETAETFRKLLESWSFVSVSQSGQETRQAMVRACDYIDRHYMQPLTLGQMAQRANLSPSYFGQLFKQYAGVSFIAYLNNVRIDKAKTLLLEEDIKIYEAAEMVGFVSLPHFNRMFKSLTGKTPNDYRKGMGLK
ncbi:response regulator transcription factor [Cohnella phaseoli]|uniref:Two-component system response regulator YesN n=1 Tax=Cohnella phaseoli TaxID=456490 RepID=A0A3D9IJW9_9BACL|nr:helix-turn-helix domain-containing protein [Cohnella phaseoli]RED61947.1 two-component system response regulator YesN [Cohnella phaseoli]